MPVGEVRLHGLADLHRGLKRFGLEEAKRLDGELIEGGKIVADAAAGKVPMAFANTEGNFRSKTKGFGRVVVTRARSKQKRGDFGSLLMVRALLPAREESADRILDHIDHMLGRLAGEEGF